MIIVNNKLYFYLDNYKFKRINLRFEDFNLEKQYRDERKHKYTLHNYGTQLFCKFKILEKINKAGIYVFVFDDIVKYVGECENFYNRINSGYGNISPRNCYIGGQITNCKINGIINSSKNQGVDVSLYFYETDLDSCNRKRLESKLISKLDLINKGYNNKK